MWIKKRWKFSRKTYFFYKILANKTIKAKKNWSKWRWEQRFKRRASIEPVMGHLKQDNRLGRNYLKSEIGDSVNLLLSCVAFNLKKLINSPEFIFARFKLALKLIFKQNILFLFSYTFE